MPSTHIRWSFGGLPTCSAYFGAGRSGDDAFSCLGMDTVTSRRSPLPVMTLKEISALPDATAAAICSATALAVVTGLPRASTMTSPATSSFA